MADVRGGTEILEKEGVLLSVFIENEAEWCKANFCLKILCQKFPFFSINPVLALHVIRSKWCNMSCIIRIKNISLLEGHSLFGLERKLFVPFNYILRIFLHFII